MLQGFATAIGTLEYSRRYPALPYQMLGRTGLAVSGAGFGSYRVDDGILGHRQAFAEALRSGINLVDTSANYADGGAERLIGNVLNELATQGEVRRDEMIVVSKGGYLQGENYRLSQQRQREGRPFPELVPYGEGLEHCIHPRFLAEQISSSLERLKLDTIDCYLLHNPEYYLMWANKQHLSRAKAQGEYWRRIREAFLYLEEEVVKGRIRWYGISSNTFVRPQRDYAFTSLTKAWETAASLGSSHHFGVVEFPFNLFEAEAILEANQPGGESVLEFAREKELAVLINRPFNAIQGNDLIRLADNVYQDQGAENAAAFRKQIAALDQEWEDASTLTHLALRALRSTKGVSSVLVGMRHTSYVEDVLKELRRPCVAADRRTVWEKVRGIVAAR
ncbi:MAG: aldo/keto reductase [Negativicutes bacterium]|nr:aldo/keto reductase [Negativicutes bacterium]